MNTFYTKLTPILVIAHLICASEIVNNLLMSLLLAVDFESLVTIFCMVLAIFVINLVTIIKAHSKWKSDFSIMEYVVFVVALPCIAPFILTLILLGFIRVMDYFDLFGGLV